jgi:hypothetical protein
MTGQSAQPCFLCTPQREVAAEHPYRWSSPRALCVMHKSGALLENGEPLAEALGRLGSVEGSTLAWIFNPVRVGADARRGWTDFAAGGMAVFEDRFGAESYFEFRAFECDADLLYAVHCASGDGATLAPDADIKTAMAFLLRLLDFEKRAKPPRRAPPFGFDGAYAGMEDLMRAWCFAERLATQRRTEGVTWPGSSDDVLRWLHACFPGATTDQNLLAPVLAEVCRIAPCRFATGIAR